MSRRNFLTAASAVAAATVPSGVLAKAALAEEEAVTGLAGPVVTIEAEGPITQLFSQWQPALDAVFAADEARGENDNGDAFMAAYRVESDIRRAIAEADAFSLRELQMKAFAYTSDGCGCGGIEKAERMLASDREWDREHDDERERGTTLGYHRIPAYTFAIALMRMAEADPNGPRYPIIPERYRRLMADAAAAL